LIDYPLYDWAAAEKAFAELESPRHQRPQIASLSHTYLTRTVTRTSEPERGAG
jgi:hypothetical protein